MENTSQNSWRYDPKFRALFFQALCFFIVAAGIAVLIYNTQKNLENQNIASGFGFLNNEAGFEISESLIEYWADDTYRKALWVGILNTLKVALIGNVIAIFLGVFIGIARLSENWLLSRLSYCYIETARNIPLLLQLFFWYAIFTEIFPNIKEAWEILPHTYLSQRGLVFPIFATHPAWSRVGWSLVFAFSLSFGLHYLLKRLREKTGRVISSIPIIFAVLLILPFLTWAISGAPTELNIPEMGGFNFSGGMSITPEFVALLLGLVLYTGAFNAEIVRSGIEAVDKGQWEASSALGLTRLQALRLVVLPQSLRVIIPPLTSQILNLVKNSSLAVGIGYPDFVAVANTTMNQTGQAIEGVMLIMGVYLCFSLTTSLILNFYNRRISLEVRS